eukprot:403352541
MNNPSVKSSQKLSNKSLNDYEKMLKDQQKRLKFMNQQANHQSPTQPLNLNSNRQLQNKNEFLEDLIKSSRNIIQNSQDKSLNKSIKNQNSQSTVQHQHFNHIGQNDKQKFQIPNHKKLHTQTLQTDQLQNLGNGQVVLDHYKKIMETFDHALKSKSHSPEKGVSHKYFHNQKQELFLHDYQKPNFTNKMLNHSSVSINDQSNLNMQSQAFFNDQRIPVHNIYTERSKQDLKQNLVSTQELFKKKNVLGKTHQISHLQNQLQTHNVDYPMKQQSDVSQANIESSNRFLGQKLKVKKALGKSQESKVKNNSQKQSINQQSTLFEINQSGNYGVINNHININLPDISNTQRDLISHDVLSSRERINELSQESQQHLLNQFQNNHSFSQSPLTMQTQQNYQNFPLKSQFNIQLQKQTLPDHMKHMKISEYFQKNHKFVHENLMEIIRDKINESDINFQGKRKLRKVGRHESNSYDYYSLSKIAEKQSLNISADQSSSQEINNYQTSGNYASEFQHSDRLINSFHQPTASLVNGLNNYQFLHPKMPQQNHNQQSQQKLDKMKNKVKHQHHKSSYINKKNIVLLTNVFVNLPSINLENKKADYFAQKQQIQQNEDVLYQQSKQNEAHFGNQFNVQNNQVKNAIAVMDTSFYSIEPWDNQPQSQNEKQKNIRPIYEVGGISGYNSKLNYLSPNKELNNLKSTIEDIYKQSLTDSPIDLDKL